MTFKRNIKDRLIEATITLFKAVPIIPSTPRNTLDNKINIEHGFYITEDAYKNCPRIADTFNIKLIETLYGYNLCELNRGFYKSFATVRDAEPEELFKNQIMHYFTTYGLESLGIRDENIVYIPPEKLKLPKNANPVKITIINFITNEEIEARVNKIIASGMALNSDTLNYITIIVRALKLTINIDNVPNKELRIKLYDTFNKLPTKPIEFLRFVVYKKMYTTMLIKSPETIYKIKTSNEKIATYFKKYLASGDGLQKLSSIFFRFKPLWLAFKHESKYMASIINKMRKMAETYHEPVKPKILDTITSSKNINMTEFRRELAKVTIFKKVSLANSILFRSAAPQSIIYFIRNSKAFTKEYDKQFEINEDILNEIINSIVEDVRPQVEGKTIYIPDNFEYAMPTSEKLFWNTIPYNSSYTLSGKSVVIGVHWFNVKNEKGIEERVDLDLHFQSSKYDVGWNDYMEDKNIQNAQTSTIIFSGDMTDAPIKKGGATEAFFIGKNIVNDMSIINLNNFTANSIPVPFKFIIDEAKADRINRKYLINSHTMSFCLPNQIDGTEMFLGFLQSDKSGNKKFYFTSASMSKRIVSCFDENAEKAVQALQTTFDSCLKLKDVLKRAGAVFEKTDDKDYDINLDTQVLTKDTIINLFTKDT